jgi:hypothetical protein
MIRKLKLKLKSISADSLHCRFDRSKETIIQEQKNIPQHLGPRSPCTTRLGAYHP